jgi:hypothetical protein
MYVLLIDRYIYYILNIDFLLALKQISSKWCILFLPVKKNGWMWPYDTDTPAFN